MSYSKDDTLQEKILSWCGVAFVLSLTICAMSCAFAFVWWLILGEAPAR